MHSRAWDAPRRRGCRGFRWFRRSPWMMLEFARHHSQGWGEGKARAEKLLSRRRTARVWRGSRILRPDLTDEYDADDDIEEDENPADVSPRGWIGGAPSVIGASADITRSGGKVTITSVPMRSFDFSVKVPPCRSIRFLAIGRPEAGALFGRFDRVRALAERGQHDRDFLFGNAGAGVFHAHILAAGRGPTDLEPDLAALRRELDGVGQKVEANLAHRALVGP